MSNFSTSSDAGEVSAIDHVYFSPIKKDKQKKRLSKIGFPSAFNDSEMNNTDSNLSPEGVPSMELSLSQNHSNKSSSSFNLPKVLDSTRNKFHMSNNSSSNLVNKLPYKTSRSNSAVSINTASRSSSFNNNQSLQNHLKGNSNTSAYHPSPKKANNRFLATNNDHTFQLNTESTPGKGLPISLLPQFSHIHQSSTHQLSSTHQPPKVASIPTVMAPPFVLEPIAKVSSNSSNVDMSGNSSNTEGSTTSLKKKKKNSNILLKAPKPVHYRHQPSASIGSFLTDETENESTNGSLTSYKLSDFPEPKLKNVTSNGTDPWSAKTNTASSNLGSYDIEDTKLHLISPSIINEFEMLHESIRFGMKKQLENLDLETQTLILELDKSFKHLDQLHIEALERGKDLDTFIENMSTSKNTEIESLNPNVMCDNLNDLEVRIEQVKTSMSLTKDNLKAFGSKLTVLKEWKKNNEVRSKFFRNMLVISSAVILFAVSIKKVFF